MCQKALRSGKAAKKSLTDPVKQMMEQAQRANDIIRSIRGFAKKGELRDEAVDINDAINQIADLLRSDARDHSTSISFELAHDTPPVSANMLQLQQVILNLSHNGIEAMMDEEPGRRHLTIQTESLADGSVELSVHDTGCGIEPEFQEKIFAPFYTSKPDGVGMGLSISQSIIEAHGGRLWATSNGDGRTCFHVSLPGLRTEARDGK